MEMSYYCQQCFDSNINEKECSLELCEKRFKKLERLKGNHK